MRSNSSKPSSDAGLRGVGDFSSTPYYRVMCIGVAFVVAYESARGELIAVSEHGTGNSAKQEAYRLNVQRAAQSREHSQAVNAYEVRHRFTSRYFEPDAFA